MIVVVENALVVVGRKSALNDDLCNAIVRDDAMFLLLFIFLVLIVCSFV